MKSTVYSQTLSLYGIGPLKAKKICTLAGYKPHFKSVTPVILMFLTNFADTSNIQLLGYNLRRRALLYMLHLRRMKSYRGMRHAAGLPIRGQRTHTNGKTPPKFKQLIHLLDTDTILRNQAYDYITYGSRKTRKKKKSKKKFRNKKKQKLTNINPRSRKGKKKSKKK